MHSEGQHRGTAPRYAFIGEGLLHGDFGGDAGGSHDVEAGRQVDMCSTFGYAAGADHLTGNVVDGHVGCLVGFDDDTAIGFDHSDIG